MSKTVPLEQVKLAGQLLLRERKARLDLEKEATDFRLEKRAQKIAFREVELGICEPFQSNEEFMSKVASLMKEDLDVVEKALERGYSPARRDGELDESTSAHSKMNPLERWVKHGDLD